MKLCCGFEMLEMGDEVIAVPVGNTKNQFSGVLKLNSSGAEVFKMLMDGVSISAIVDSLAKRYALQHDEVQSVIAEFLVTLRQGNIITD